MLDANSQAHDSSASSDTSATSATSERELVTTRLIDADRETVFAAFSDPAHLSKWWGPRGFTTTTHDFAFKPGGRWKLTMHGPDGRDYPNLIVYEEISAPSRIVTTHHGDSDTVQFQHTFSFAEEGKKTRVTIRAVFASRAQRDFLVKTYHADLGAKETLERLGEVATKSTASTRAAVPELVMVRTFDAPRELVFSAWKKAEHVSKWFTPRPLTTSECVVDCRVGGTFRVVMRFPNGSEHAFAGAFTRVDEPAALAFAGKLEDGNAIDTVVTFEDQAGKTTLTVRQSYKFASDATRGAHEGWTASLDQLREVVSALPARAG